MKKLLLVVLGTLFAGTAFAGVIYPKTAVLLWQRSPDTQHASAYNTATSNGVHDANGNGIAVPVQDTSQAIDVRDHWSVYYRTNKTEGTLAADSTVGSFGTLLLRTTKHSIDSIMVFRDFSADGVRWTAVDSIAGHVQSDTTSNGSSAVSDSVFFRNSAPAVILSPNGIASRVVSYSWQCNPFMQTGGITALAGVAAGPSPVNFIRFRIHMTAGDYAAASSGADGVIGTFTYQAQDPSYPR